MSYATLAQARLAGITTAVYGNDLASDERLQALLNDASEYIDRYTGWWFEPRTKTLTFDGDGCECLWLPAPIVSLTSVSISGTTLDLASVLQYGTAASGQELRAARLARVGSSIGLYPVSVSTTWPRGRRNITVVGSFGYVKEDGTSPPTEIRDVCIRLALRSLRPIADPIGAAERRATSVYRETTDNHSYELAGGMPGAAGSWRQGGLQGDPEIDTALARHRRPSRGARV